MIWDLFEIVFRAIVCVAAVIALTRINGLRSFSKMSSFDFAITVACGSIIASSVISPGETVLFGVAALVALFALQGGLAWARVHFGFARDTVDNAPVLIMEKGEILRENLHSVKMTEADLMGKLREANAFDLSHVHAVIFEPTGDVSVLHGKESDPRELSDAVMAGVQR